MKYKVLIGLTIFASSVCAAVPSNIHAFMDKMNHNAVVQKQKNLLKQQKFDASVQRSQQEDAPPAISPVSSILKNSNGTTSEINCDESNEYNYPSNFVYNENHQKVYRLHPFAKCMTSAPGAQTPVVTPQSDNAKEKEQTTSQWNINY